MKEIVNTTNSLKTVCTLSWYLSGIHYLVHLCVQTVTIKVTFVSVCSAKVYNSGWHTHSCVNSLVAQLLPWLSAHMQSNLFLCHKIWHLNLSLSCCLSHSLTHMRTHTHTHTLKSLSPTEQQHNNSWVRVRCKLWQCACMCDAYKSGFLGNSEFNLKSISIFKGRQMNININVLLPKFTAIGAFSWNSLAGACSWYVTSSCLSRLVQTSFNISSSFSLATVVEQGTGAFKGQPSQLPLKTSLHVLSVCDFHPRDQ